MSTKVRIAIALQIGFVICLSSVVIAQERAQEEVAQPITTEAQRKLEEKQRGSVEPFEKVQDRVEERLEFLRRQKAVAEIEAEVAQQAVISNKEEFIDFCLEKIYQMSNEEIR